MSSWPMLAGLLVMAALAGVEAWRDKTARKPLSWRAYLRARGRATWWTSRRSTQERDAVALSIGKEA